MARASWLVASLLSLLCLLFAPAASARGVRVESPRIEEDKDTHSWKLKLTLDYGSPPDRDVVPMVFSFKQTATYERSLTDESPDKPVMHTVPMSNQAPNNSEQEVGFADAATGKRYPVTKMSMTLRRRDDFEAGEYELTVKLPGGGTLGVVRLQLVGDNKPVDRRSLNLGASVGGGKKTAKKDADSAPKPASGAAEDQGPDLSNIPDVPKGGESGEKPNKDVDPPPSVPPKQGGCGCRIAAETDPPVSLAAIACFLSLILIRRRRGN